MLVGLSGKFCAGKDALGDYLIEKYHFRRVSFADKLKSVCVDLFGMVGKDRTLLQDVGTALRKVDELVWIKYPFKSVKDNENIVITDVRYRNEFDYIKKKGGYMIRLECQQDIRKKRYEKIYKKCPTFDQVYHISETDLDHATFDLVIDTGATTKEESREIARQFLMEKRVEELQAETAIKRQLTLL